MNEVKTNLDSFLIAIVNRGNVNFEDIAEFIIAGFSNSGISKEAVRGALRTSGISDYSTFRLLELLSLYKEREK